MATKSNHHYVPQFYLRGFSEGVGRKARIFVFDSESKRPFRTLVRNVGSRRYFNRVEAHGVGPDYVEDTMSEIESEIAPHLDQVVAARAFPTEEHFASIMNLIAILSVRNPRVRGAMTDFHRDLIDRIMGITVSTKEIWETQLRRMRESGIPLRDGVTYEEIKRFHQEQDFEIIIDQTHLIGLELTMIEPVLQELYRRSWCFACAPSSEQFITCDDPTVLSWTGNVPKSTFYSPGHGLQNTMVVFTLSPAVALVGLFEKLPERSEYGLEQIAALNTSVARHSRSQIYARDDGFVLHLKNRQFARGYELHQALRDLD